MSSSDIEGYSAIPKEESDASWDLPKTFSLSVALILAALLVGLSVLTDFTVEHATDDHVNQYYMYYIHVAMMIFVGFGFLMTFLRRYSYSAVGLNFFASCVVMLEFIVVGGWVQQVIFGTGSSTVLVDLPLLIDAAFAAGAAMISFGAMLGKTSPTQLLWLLVIQVPIYTVNAHVVFEVLSALDIGGSISIHAFGAYYGLAASMALPKPAAFGHTKNSANYSSDITAMIGTIFLWIFWPSFNGALGSSSDGVSAQQFHCVLNTVLALLGACLVTFMISAALEGKFNMVHIQNATLAGGVSIGSSANLTLVPAWAVSVGVLAGTLSTLGYIYVTPYLEAKIKLHDTCGVHNLHGMPGVFGALASAFASAVLVSSNTSLLGSGQPSRQVAAIGCTLLVAMTSGYLAGRLVGAVNPYKQDLADENLFEDAVFWSEVELEEAGEVVAGHIHAQ